MKLRRATFCLLFSSTAIAAPDRSVEFCGETLKRTATEVTCYRGRTTNMATQTALDLRPLAALRRLSSLSIVSGEIEFVLSRRVDDLAPLAGLAKLRQLSFGHTSVADLKPLATLTSLEELSLHAAKVRDLAPLKHLRGLRSLDLSHNPVVDLQPLMHLNQLERLDLTRTLVTDLSPLAGLKTLKRLGLNSTFDPKQVAALKATHPELTVYEGRTW